MFQLNRQYVPLVLAFLFLGTFAFFLFTSFENSAVNAEPNSAALGSPLPTLSGFKLDTTKFDAEYEREPTFDMQRLVRSVRYPREAIRDSIEGIVRVRVLIGIDGTTMKAKVIEPVHPLLDAEALRVMLNFKDWTPAIIKGAPAPCWIVVPIRFRLKK